MKIQGSTKIRSQIWEDDPPAATPPRRAQQGAPPLGHPFESAPPGRYDSDGGDSPRFGEYGNPWWRPSSAWGRAFLTLAALIVLAALFTTGYLLKSWLNGDSRFRIAGATNIQAAGLTEISRTELLPIFGEDIGRNIFFVPLAERRRQLEQIPWVERATVMRLLPDQIRVSVVERQPVAFARIATQVGLVDANGVLLSMPAAVMAKHHYSFPVVSGIDPHDAPESRKNRMVLYLRLLSELDANNQHLSAHISEVDLTDPEDARVTMPEQGGDILAHFGEDHFLDRYQHYRAHIAEWRQQYPNLSEVDLRYEQQVVLKMAQRADAQQGAAAGAPPASSTQAETAAPNPPKQKAAPAHAPVKGKTAKASAVVGWKAAAKSKPAAPKSKSAAAKDKRKRAAAKRIPLKSNRSKSRPAAQLRQGQ